MIINHNVDLRAFVSLIRYEHFSECRTVTRAKRDVRGGAGTRQEPYSADINYIVVNGSLVLVTGSCRLQLWPRH